MLKSLLFFRVLENNLTPDRNLEQYHQESKHIRARAKEMKVRPTNHSSKIRWRKVTLEGNQNATSFRDKSGRENKRLPRRRSSKWRQTKSTLPPIMLSAPKYKQQVDRRRDRDKLAALTEKQPLTPANSVADTEFEERYERTQTPLLLNVTGSSYPLSPQNFPRNVRMPNFRYQHGRDEGDEPNTIREKYVSGHKYFLEKDGEENTTDRYKNVNKIKQTTTLKDNKEFLSAIRHRQARSRYLVIHEVAHIVESEKLGKSKMPSVVASPSPWAFNRRMLPPCGDIGGEASQDVDRSTLPVKNVIDDFSTRNLRTARMKYVQTSGTVRNMNCSSSKAQTFGGKSMPSAIRSNEKMNAGGLPLVRFPKILPTAAVKVKSVQSTKTVSNETSASQWQFY